MVRVMFLLSIADRRRRHELMRASIGGMEWRHPNGRRITDRQMVELATRLQGWAASVYRFGCSFIHLSKYHDYLATDPLRLLSRSEVADLLAHIRFYHGGLHMPAPRFGELIPYLPAVFAKISDNLRCYVDALERGGDLT